MGNLIAEPDQPERPPMLGEAQGLIFKDRNPSRGERPAHAQRVIGRFGGYGGKPPVVIPENGIDAERRFETGELLRPSARRHIARNERMRAYKIAEQHRQVRPLSVGEIDDLADALFRHPRIACVDVGDDRDSELKVVGPTVQARRVLGERERRPGFIRCRVTGERQCRRDPDASADEKPAPGHINHHLRSLPKRSFALPDGYYAAGSARASSRPVGRR